MLESLLCVKNINYIKLKLASDVIVPIDGIELQN